MRTAWRRRVGGFSLLELALVVVLLGILGGGLLGSLQAQLVNQRYREAQRALALAEQALLGYAAAEGARFPCPDADRDGRPDVGADGACRVAEGGLPWALLGIGGSDPWGETLRYRPDSALLAAGGFGNPPDTLDGLEVLDTAHGRSLTLGVPHGPVALVFSCGANRAADGANTARGAAGTCNAAGSPDLRYEHGRPRADFDDVLIWVSKNVVLARLIEAGAWP